MNAQFIRLVTLVARRDYLRTVRRRGFVAGTLLLPLGMGLVFALSTFASTSFAQPNGPIVVVNESAIAMAPHPQFTPNIQVVDRADAEARLEAKTISEYYLVPSQWPQQPTVLVVEQEQASGQPQLSFARHATQQSEMDLLLRVSLIKSAGLPDTVLAELLAPVKYQAIFGSGEEASDAQILSSYFVPYVFTLIFMLSIFITSGYLLQSVTEEKENRVVEIVLSSVPALPLMAGKVIGLGAAGLTQVVVWIGTALIALPFINSQFALDIAVSPVTLTMAVVFFTLGYMAYGAIYAAVGALSPGAREAQQYASFFGIVAVVPIVLLPVILTDPSSPIVIALCLLPLTAPAAILAVLAATPTTPWLLVALSTVSQVFFMIVFIIGAGRIFRATLLLYGVRPSVRRIAGAMFSRS